MSTPSRLVLRRVSLPHILATQIQRYAYLHQQARQRLCETWLHEMASSDTFSRSILDLKGALKLKSERTWTLWVRVSDDQIYQAKAHVEHRDVKAVLSEALIARALREVMLSNVGGLRGRSYAR